MRFLSCDETPLGIYPIVDRTEKLEPLYQCGITTAQLRIKDVAPQQLEREIVEAIALSKHYHVRLFINDYWELAIEHHAYGVHLGQEDIQEADIEALYRANLRLGISTHTPQEIDIALGFEPSYIAIGPVYVPISKALKYATVGPQLLQRWAESVDYPVVAIGGITLDNIEAVARTKAVSGIAMISGVLEGNRISKEKTKALIEAFEHYAH